MAVSEADWFYVADAPVAATEVGAWSEWIGAPDRAEAPDGDDFWPSGEGPGAVVSPSGRACGSLPTAARIQSWFGARFFRTSEYSGYDDTYPLASSPPGYIDMLGVTEEEYLATVGSVQWAGSPSEAQTAAAVAILDSETSEELIAELADPLAFLSRRLVTTVDREGLDGGSGTLRARVPLLDFVTTPLARILRRFRPIDEQSSAAGFRVNALDADTQALFDAIRAGVIHDFPDSTAPVPDTLSLHFEDFDDWPYNPVIGTLDATSPFLAGLWGGGGMVGLMSTLLMPSREPPTVYALPLNWRANNRLEFMGTFFSWVDELDAVIASHNESNRVIRTADLVEWLEGYGVTGLQAFDELRTTYDEADGHVVVMTDALSSLFMDDLLDKVSDAQDGLAGFAGQGNVVPEWVDLLVVVATATAPWLLIPYLVADEDLDDVVAEVGAALDEAFTTLTLGLEEATTPGRPVNDALVIALMTAGSAFEAVRTSDVKLIFYREELGDIAGLSAAFEEKMLMGFTHSADFRALAVGLAGDWYESWLSDGEDLAAGLSDEAGHQLVLAIEELRAQHEGAVPVWTVDEGFLDWDFSDFEAFTWYFHQQEVTVDSAGALAESGTTRNLAAWVEAVSPLVQLILAIDAASALLEAGLQAESFVLAMSGLPTGDDSMAQQARIAFEALGASRISEVLPGISIPRFVGAVWRQAMTDRLLLDLEAEGNDMDAIYEVVRWMRTDTDRGHIDAILGPLDAELGRRRYEEGLVGRLGKFEAPEEDLPEDWLLYSSLDESWESLTADEREAWITALPYLVDRDPLADLRELIDATRSDSGSAVEEPSVVDGSVREGPLTGFTEVELAEERLDPTVLLALERIERDAARSLALGWMTEIVVGEVLPMDGAVEVGSLTGWTEVLADGDLAAAERWAAMADGLGDTRARMLRSWMGA